MKRINVVLLACTLVSAMYGQAFAAESAAGKAMELPAADRKIIEGLLGKDVVGAPVAGNPISDIDKVFTFTDSAQTYRFVGGDKKGDTQRETFTVSKRDQARTTGQYAAGPNIMEYLRRSEDGSIVLVSEQDKDEGVITRYSPPEPMLVSGLKPGDSKKSTIAVKVYDLSDPKEVSHTGSLDVTYSYIGAYEVTVPAGTYDAALLKWDYEGEVGPATIKDVQYRLVAKDVGMVASIDKLHVHAVLIYNKNTKSGKVLVTNK